MNGAQRKLIANCGPYRLKSVGSLTQVVDNTGAFIAKFYGFTAAHEAAYGAACVEALNKVTYATPKRDG